MWPGHWVEISSPQQPHCGFLNDFRSLGANSHSHGPQTSFLGINTSLATASQSLWASLWVLGWPCITLKDYIAFNLYVYHYLAFNFLENRFIFHIIICYFIDYMNFMLCEDSKTCNIWEGFCFPFAFLWEIFEFWFWTLDENIILYYYSLLRWSIKLKIQILSVSFTDKFRISCCSLCVLRSLTGKLFMPNIPNLDYLGF